MMSSNRAQNMACEQQAKFIQERISTVEKHFADLCAVFAEYTRKNASVRNKNDDLAQSLQNYAQSENVNKSLKNGLLEFSQTLSFVSDYRDAKVKRLEKKVVEELSAYDGICKHAKETVKNSLSVRDRELARRKQLDRVRERNPHNRQQISIAESELLKATADLSRTVRSLEEQTDMFEKKKLHDIKSIILNYIIIELSFHAKAVELFTKAYQQVSEVDEEEDMEDFRNALQIPDSVARLETVKRMSFKNSSFSLSNLFATPHSTHGGLQSTGSSARESSGSLKELSQVEDFATGDSSSVASEEYEKYSRNRSK
ncbi:CBY1-interacting BAR domain-containing protein 1 isoform X2 [Schistocerca serialis cubense]|uniref:CBY1-interacting BAR domain-containing protein 1 isoform X2 n=1 Tax=Schistocerca serialis cubense TaxID=2023355 RepID=UPI00214EFA62|nr:CBY1-interacting BAR domain-containing protein 1 isoform X2 [Schistocerca serialis cubense]